MSKGMNFWRRRAIVVLMLLFLGGLACAALVYWSLWVRYDKIEDAGFVFPIPVHAYVEKVYERFAFAQLFGFG